MSEATWRSVPVGIDAQRWVTLDGCRTVLVIVHSVVSGQRLLDVVGLVETDLRIQTVYVQGPSAFSDGVSALLASWGALEIPWQQAINEKFDLALAAGYNGLDEIHAPLMVLPHGAGYAKRARGYRGNVVDITANDRAMSRPIYGLDMHRLVRDDRLIPASVVLSHEAQRAVLDRQCPQASDVAIVAGDPCYDRMRVSVGRREDYRTALGLAPQSRLVVVASTWGRHSLFARNANLFPALLSELDQTSYTVVGLFHPAVWFGHGPRQLKAWLSEACEAGLTLVDPHLDWRVAVLAADFVIGDHGSTTVYAASVGVPVLHAGLPECELDTASAQAWLATQVPRLDLTRPVESQLDEAGRRQVERDTIVSRLTSLPGQSHRVLRAEMYRLLGLSVPGRHRDAEPIPVSREHGAGHA